MRCPDAPHDGGFHEFKRTQQNHALTDEQRGRGRGRRFRFSRNKRAELCRGKAPPFFARDGRGFQGAENDRDRIPAAGSGNSVGGETLCPARRALFVNQASIFRARYCVFCANAIYFSYRRKRADNMAEKAARVGFQKDDRRVIERGVKIEPLEQVAASLAAGEPLAEKNRDRARPAIGQAIGNVMLNPAGGRPPYRTPRAGADCARERAAICSADDRGRRQKVFRPESEAIFGHFRVGRRKRGRERGRRFPVFANKSGA